VISKVSTKVKIPSAIKQSEGFVLIEVMVGLAILGIVMISAMRAIGQAADTQLAISQRTMALWSADNVLLDLRMKRTWPDLGMTSVACPQANHVFLCQRKVIATPNPAFRRVEVAVYLGSSAGSTISSGSRLAWLTTVVPNLSGGIL
jgi:general secretion pathway protein I